MNQLSDIKVSYHFGNFWVNFNIEYFNSCFPREIKKNSMSRPRFANNCPAHACYSPGGDNERIYSTVGGDEKWWKDLLCRVNWWKGLLTFGIELDVKDRAWCEKWFLMEINVNDRDRLDHDYRGEALRYLKRGSEADGKWWVNYRS